MTKPSFGRTRAIALALAALVFGACGDDPTAPTNETVAGAYEATVFLSGSLDLLAAGSTFRLTLGADGTVSGLLSIPEEAGGPFLADMAGTYTLTGTTIRLEQGADSFVRDIEWNWSEDGRLDGTFDGDVPITARLVR